MNKRQFFSLVGAFLALALPCRAADSIFLDLKIGTVKYEGTSRVRGFEKRIECGSLQQSIAAPGPGTVRPNARAEARAEGGVTLNLTKIHDGNSPQLIQAFLEGLAIEGKFSFVKTNQDRADEYYTIDGKRGRVTDIGMAAGGGGAPNESITITFSEVTWTSIPLDDKGKPLGKPVVYSYKK
ncbi:type VI secretion system tube protein Hcp [Armatimonas sp.]|uniref:type VI secretion system tube protein Hcp n=1 Tax=Armatimonas sp. TaxID=1872638 RepID=UPI00374D05D5